MNKRIIININNGSKIWEILLSFGLPVFILIKKNKDVPSDWQKQLKQVRQDREKEKQEKEQEIINRKKAEKEWDEWKSKYQQFFK